MIDVLEGHDWWARHTRALHTDVRAEAERLATEEGKGVYQQHVLRAAANVSDLINTATWANRQGRAGRLSEDLVRFHADALASARRAWREWRAA
jgi:hypothetical protein